jgi:hypothetical protein
MHPNALIAAIWYSKWGFHLAATEPSEKLKNIQQTSSPTTQTQARYTPTAQWHHHEAGNSFTTD